MDQLRYVLRKYVAHRRVMVAMLGVGVMVAPVGVPGFAASRSVHRFAASALPRLYVDRRNTHAPATAFAQLRRLAATHGDVEAVVGLQTTFAPDANLSAQALVAQRRAIVTQAKTVTDRLAGSDFSVIREYVSVPYIALRLSPEAVARLQQSGVAASVHESVEMEPADVESSRQVEADEAQTLGRTGYGQIVVIVDSGIDKTHPFLQQTDAGPSKVVAEACFSKTASCPNHSTTMTGPGSGVHCTFSDACDHGTHVAGIAAGRRTTGVTYSGVANRANLISIRVASNPDMGCVSHCGLTIEDVDQLAAYDYVHATLVPAFHNIAAVNASIESSDIYGSGVCDADFPDFVDAYNQLIGDGIAPVVSSGNYFSNAGVAFPGCISNAVTVGSVTDADTVSAFSNSSSTVDLLAPGGGRADLDDPGGAIESSVPGGTYAGKIGTSMAAPHVAGAFAVLRQLDPTSSVYALLSYLSQTGKPVTNPFNGVTTPSIRVLAASLLVKDTGFVAPPPMTFQGAQVGAQVAAWGFAKRAGAIERYDSLANSPSANLTIPAGATVRAAILYWMTVGGRDGRTLFQGPDPCPPPPQGVQPCVRAGTLIGAARDRNPPFFNPQVLRVYRYNIPVNEIKVGANTRYIFGGVGGRGPGADGEGASLVIIYTTPVVGTTGKVVIRQGAMAASGGDTLTASFTGLSVPAAPSAVNLLVGMGDGQTGSGGSEDPMKFKAGSGSAVNITASNAFFSQAGPLWDAKNLSVNKLLLPAGTTTVANSIHTIDETLDWPYSILTYQYPS